MKPHRAQRVFRLPRGNDRGMTRLAARVGLRFDPIAARSGQRRRRVFGLL
jgi:hypothetical protein